jgi:prophage tail gpP-like protein
MIVVGDGTTDLVLTVGGANLTGWTETRVTLGLERMPNDFDLAITEADPAQAGQIVVKTGDPCQISIKGRKVITGYIDRWKGSGNAKSHNIRVTGRSKSQDLVDCSAVLPQMSISGVNALTLAQQLAKPYGISVSQASGPTPMIPAFSVTLGETPYEIIERICRFSGLLAYDDADGNVILGQVGTAKAASGFTYGVNVESWDVSFSADQRYQTYLAAIMNTHLLSEQGGDGNIVQQVHDEGVTRFRQLIIVSEQMMGGQSFAKVRAQWEMARRWGRSQEVTLGDDSWWDTAGQLWWPNTIATINVPPAHLVGVDWVIGEASLVYGAEGTRASVKLMPRQAFTPDPEILQPFDYQVNQALGDGAGVAGNP